jgi:hypothetical protein
VHYLFLKNTDMVRIYAVGDGVMVSVISGGSLYIIGTGGEQYCVYEAAHDLNKLGFRRAEAVFLPELSKKYAACFETAEQILDIKSLYAAEDGTNADKIYYLAKEQGIDTQKIDGIDYYVSGGNLRLSCYIDKNNAKWMFGSAGELSFVICPEKGDAKSLPEAFLSPDCAIILDDVPANFSYLRPVSTIISNNEQPGEIIKSQLVARGIKNIFTLRAETGRILTAAGQATDIKEFSLQR